MLIPLYAYLGPETMLPLASVIAGIVGAFMMFGRNTFRFFARCVRGFGRGK